MSVRFISKEPSLDDYWRGIILFGRNVASYKFALAKSLLELRPEGGDLLKLQELAPVYAGYLCEHLKHSDKQITSKSSGFLDGCRKYNSGVITKDELVALTVRDGFNNVIDAFHIVGQEEIPRRFYFDERKNNAGIRLSDEFSALLENQQSVNLPVEVEARWRLVETAWELGIARNLVTVDYDAETESLFAIDRAKRRKSVTGSRDALNGYQKGQCFYCFSDIYINASASLYPDVDHFFPHRLAQMDFGANIDGIWNLVLSCQECNRGVGGKSDRIPTIRLLERLNTRNEFLISSHHPLRETLMLQTGASTQQRRAFLNDVHDKARAALIHTWEAEERGLPKF